MSKRKLEQPDGPSADPSDGCASENVDRRAAELRAKVEALAAKADSSHGLDDVIAEGEDEKLGLPMLIRTTDTGIYLKWSLMLQEQLARLFVAFATQTLGAYA